MLCAGILEAVGWSVASGQPEPDIPDALTSRPSIYALDEENIGSLPPLLIDELEEAGKAYPFAWLEGAFREAVAQNRRNWKYISRILERWKLEGPNYEAPGRSLRGYNRNDEERLPDRISASWIAEPEIDDSGAICPHCRGAGFVRRNVPLGDPDFGHAVSCKCVQDESDGERRERLSRYSNLGASRPIHVRPAHSSRPER